MSVQFPKWWFPLQSPVRANENSNAEHFRTMDMEDKAQSFVRESFQNSIDGAISSDATVRLRIYLSGKSKALPVAVAGKYMDSLFDHLDACSTEIKVDVDSLRTTPCQFLVFEDFGTTGLTGDEAVWNLGDPATKNNHFFHFFRTVGRSGKVGEKLGRWGIGKFVFLMASEARALFGYTVRASEGGKTDRLLMGSSTLRFHQIGEASYVNEGWFAEEMPPQSLAMPIADDSLLDEFVQDWNISRTSETGLSIVVPFVDEIDGEDFLYTIINEYCGKILEGRLEVDLEIGEDQIPVRISKGTVRSIVAAHDGDKRWDSVARTVDALTWYGEIGRDEAIALVSTMNAIKVPRWANVSLADEVVDEIRTVLDDQQRVVVRIPASITKNEPKRTEDSYFDLILVRQPKGKQRSAASVFFRRWLRISGRQMGYKINGVDSYLIVGDGMLGSLLGDAEGPAHTEWSPERDIFKDAYVYGPEWLTFVKSAPRKVFELVTGATAERNYHAFEDLFPKSLPLSGAKKDGTEPKLPEKGKGGKTGKPTTPDPGPPPGLKILFSEDGFKVRCDNSAPVTAVLIEIAFDVKTGDPFKKWHPADFDLNNLKVVVNSGTGKVLSWKENTLTAEVTDMSDFEISVTGFDSNRDLCVRATPSGGEG